MPPGDDQRMLVAAIGRMQRDAGEVQTGEQVGVAEFGAEGHAEQVEGGDRPKIWISAPVRDAAGEVIAVLDIGKPADERFALLFATAGVGATGENFAFDGRGVLLTESRFRDALVERGSLRAGENSLLRQRLDDPESGGEPQFTRLVAQALAGRSAEAARLQGEVLQPYATYYGERVVGAWRWLQEHEATITRSFWAPWWKPPPRRSAPIRSWPR